MKERIKYVLFLVLLFSCITQKEVDKLDDIPVKYLSIEIGNYLALVEIEKNTKGYREYNQYNYKKVQV